MEDNSSKQPNCEKCGGPIAGHIEARQDGGTYCRSCTIHIASELVSRAESDEAVRQEEMAHRQEGRGRGLLIFQYAIILAAVVLIVLQVPTISRSLQGEKPLRQGTWETDSAGDECIANLWKVSALLQQGKTIGGLKCPVSTKPYALAKEGGTLTVNCPNPGLHGLVTLRVRKGDPVPVALK